MEDMPVHERVHVDSDPDELETVAELRYYAALQRERGSEHYYSMRATQDALKRERALTDRFLAVLEQVTARR